MSRYNSTRAIVLTMLCAVSSARAAAAEPFGFHVSGAVGRSEIQAQVPELGIDRHGERTTALEVSAGVRPRSWLAAEVAFVDLSYEGRRLAPRPLDSQVRGGIAVGVLHLPLRRLDLFIEAGPGRLRSTALGGPPNDGPGPGQIRSAAYLRTHADLGLVSGVGAQVSFGAWAMQLKYLHFDTPSGNLDASLVGLVWSRP